MKRPIVCLVSLMLILAVSCNSNIHEDMRLITISNVSFISIDEGSKALGEGSPITGVLLRFQEEGLHENSIYKLENPNAFYLEELDHTEISESGMPYNYVLYVPDCIRDAYESGNGMNPYCGNPFWWYMSTYYGRSMSQVRGNWNEVFQLLLENKEGLAFPYIEDVGKDWKPIPDGPSSDSYFATRILPRRYSYNPMTGTSYPGDDTYNKDFGYYYDKESDLHLLMFPNDIYMTYMMAGGTGDIGADYVLDNALYWYLDVYYGITQNDIVRRIDNGSIDELVSLLNSDLSNEKKADAKDLPEGLRSIVSIVLPDSFNVDLMELRAVYAYDEKNLILRDGTPIPDSNRIYCIVENWSDDIDKDRIVFYAYLPMSMIRDYEESKGIVWNGDNEPFWQYLIDEELSTFLEIQGFCKDNCKVPIELLRKVFKPLNMQ